MRRAAQTQHDMLLGFKQQTLTTYLTRSSMNIVAGPMLPLSARGTGCGGRLNCCRLNRCGRGHVSPRDACSCAATCQRAGCGAFARDAPAEAAAWGGGVRICGGAAWVVGVIQTRLWMHQGVSL